LSQSLSTGGGAITIQHIDDVPAVSRALVEGWVHDAADAVLTVYGCFPVEQVTIDRETTDLEAFWCRLGVVRRRKGVVFDDTAPLAAIRRAMTKRART
jgi:hypothetical protein